MQSDYKVIVGVRANLNTPQGLCLYELRDLLIKLEQEGLAVDVRFTPRNSTLSRKLKVKVIPND